MNRDKIENKQGKENINDKKEMNSEAKDINETDSEDLESLRQTIEFLKNEIDELKNKYLRNAAEFENYKRRTEQEFNNLKQFANEQLIADLLPIVDDFERSLKVSKERREFGPFYKGIEMIHQKLLKLFESKGVRPIDAVGKQFNVEKHDALMKTPVKNVEPNTIIDEVEKGYLLNNRVLRHSKVIVASDENESRNSGEGENEKEDKN